jgi:hypothetical protein
MSNATQRLSWENIEMTRYGKAIKRDIRSQEIFGTKILGLLWTAKLQFLRLFHDSSGDGRVFCWFEQDHMAEHEGRTSVSSSQTVNPTGCRPTKT